jgi:hypothetical protein
MADHQWLSSASDQEDKDFIQRGIAGLCECCGKEMLFNDDYGYSLDGVLLCRKCGKELEE